MKWLATGFFVIVGVALLALAGHVAFFGAERAVPEGPGVIDGVVEGSTLHDSPAGAPFVAAEVRIQEASADEHASGTVHWRGTFGEDAISVRTASGVERVELPPAETWRIVPSLVDKVTVPSLRGMPIVGDVSIGERLTAPYRVSVRAIRVGTPVIVDTHDGHATRLLIGPRAQLASERAEREGSRFPIVALLALMGAASFVVAWRLSRMSGIA